MPDQPTSGEILGTLEHLTPNQRQAVDAYLAAYHHLDTAPETTRGADLTALATLRDRARGALTEAYLRYRLRAADSAKANAIIRGALRGGGGQ